MLKYVAHPLFFFLGLILLLSITLECSPSAHASGPNTSPEQLTASVLPGTLTATLDTISLISKATTTDETQTYQIHLLVSDATGSGNGWSLALATASPHALTMFTNITITCASTSTCTPPTNGISYPVIQSQGAPLPVNVLTAEKNTGMGEVGVTITFTLTPSTGMYMNSSSLEMIVMLSNEPEN